MSHQQTPMFFPKKISLPIEEEVKIDSKKSVKTIHMNQEVSKNDETKEISFPPKQEIPPLILSHYSKDSCENSCRIKQKNPFENKDFRNIAMSVSIVNEIKSVHTVSETNPKFLEKLKPLVSQAKRKRRKIG